MTVDTKTYVVGLLESYQKRSKQIDLLHYELSHPARVTENEMIGALALAHGEGGDRPGGHASDKTLYIALNYQDRTEEANQIGADEVVEQFVDLEREQERLKYYVSLLEERQEKVIKLSKIGDASRPITGGISFSTPFFRRREKINVPERLLAP